MSGHETIRVLEVEVDASVPSSTQDGKREGGKADEGVVMKTEQLDTGGSGGGCIQLGPAVLPSSGGAGKSYKVTMYSAQLVTHTVLYMALL